MRRIRIISIAIILAIIGAILPMVLAFWLAWSHALKNEQNILMEYTHRMLSRAQDTLNGVRNMIFILEHLQIDSICSKNHIKSMRELSLQRLEDQLIGYFENNIERCNSYGTSSKIHRPKADVILSDGLELVFNTRPFSELSVEMIGLRKFSNYEIYVMPEILTNIMVPDTTSLAIIYKERVISEKNAPSYVLLNKILQKKYLSVGTPPTDNKEQIQLQNNPVQSNILIINENIVSISQYGPFLFIATEPKGKIYEHFKNNQLFILPFGFMTAIFIMALVIYFSRKKLSFRAELQKALDNHEFVVHYQPIVNIQNGECCGAEALVRWQNNEGQLVKPDLFIPYAEEIGLISNITDEVINIVFKEMEDFLRKNPTLHISINVASSDIQSGHILKSLEKKFTSSSIAPNQLWIEITERALVDIDKANKTLNAARAKGHLILIDDFGTGYSGLSYLQKLTVDILKIDKSFINSIGTRSATSNVTKHIIEMAKELHLKLVAEGVETNIQLDYLREHEVDYIQGYIFAKPLAPKEFIEFYNMCNRTSSQMTDIY
ncbi:EAL domain-containing protein [Legionella fallonii]|uniref:cyclic-guanylate-specific phosphodiesterase n=1 Tax=Legionella fallonii LLAP-10 TaxID=1212491 RepID=A0A098G4K9_9GAMM|nr:EAL domain-containing protein [Legionella fallonii]CEG56906.1 conserved exported protein of unknown function [Legionella fallonii LLAP-10]